MFERFTEKAIRVIVLAQTEARRMGWNHVGAEMILLGLISEAGSKSAKVLKQHGLSIDSLRARVEEEIGRGSDPPSIEIPFTAGAKAALVRSWHESEKAEPRVIGPDQLFLGVLYEAEESADRETDSVAYRVLRALGLDLNGLRRAVSIATSQSDAVPSLSPRESLALEQVAKGRKSVAAFAQEEAGRLDQNFIGTETILLAIIADKQSIASKTLRSFGVSLHRARTEVEKVIGRGRGWVKVEIPWTPRARRALELSWDEARMLGHDYISTEHLLLGLLREGSGVAIDVLKKMGVEPALVRQKVIEKMNSTTS